MNNLNKTAISETIEVLEHTDKEIIKKIPEKFINFLYENKDKDYEVNINFSNSNWEDKLDEDTKAILALIYRDCIVSKEEREKLLIEENEEKKNKEKLIREKYNPDNVFKKRVENGTKDEVFNNTQLAIIKKEAWYKRLYKKILALFGK